VIYRSASPTLSLPTARSEWGAWWSWLQFPCSSWRARRDSALLSARRKWRSARLLLAGCPRISPLCLFVGLRGNELAVRTNLQLGTPRRLVQRGSMPRKRRTCHNHVGFKDKASGPALRRPSLGDQPCYRLRWAAATAGWLRSWSAVGCGPYRMSCLDRLTSWLAHGHLHPRWRWKKEASTCRFWHRDQDQWRSCSSPLECCCHACRKNTCHWAASDPQQNQAQPAAATALSSTKPNHPSYRQQGLGTGWTGHAGDHRQAPSRKRRRAQQSEGPQGAGAADQLPQRGSQPAAPTRGSQQRKACPQPGPQQAEQPTTRAQAAPM